MDDSITPPILQLPVELRSAFFDILLREIRAVYYRELDAIGSNCGISTAASRQQAATAFLNLTLVNKQFNYEVESAWAGSNGNKFVVLVHDTLQPGKVTKLRDCLRTRAVVDKARSCKIGGHSGVRAGMALPDYSIQLNLRERSSPGYSFTWQHHVARDWLNLPDGRYDRMVIEVEEQVNLMVAERERMEGASALTWEGMERVLQAFLLN
ncbi:hypothetical protein LTR56_006120 [Elasticomyces elasticus]|nr:hypothetical protein LTR56_006120 [Elasticomyces elasticus]KAK3667618.1 hypothetical protein LTR22_001433 [Elasticomyces elasticus]KAK4928426.1 hypothetical protein LTR49_004833 [Elasticomyces elasticus]KAK5767227.1 hypothetical protein LTS12_002685 [Elasticomyces elasticus]